MAKTQGHAMAERLENHKYKRSECIAALRGQGVPNALGLKLLQLCTIRGIRYHHGFGEQLQGLLPEFTRALNARSIMSNMVPDISSADEEPYCIWHPEVASESTYRELALRYPSMKYQVGRACAVAGYTGLYNELGILPEIHIAEEARDGGSKAIFESIMAQPFKYKIMDDYERVINAECPVIASMNGDTAVRWMLDIKQDFGDLVDEEDFDSWELGDLVRPDGYRESMFNITEDMNLNEYETLPGEIAKIRPRCDVMRLLTEPLPIDLATCDKDILICTAAYYGDVDRYVRLRRPKLVPMELECAMRGVYHNTLYAVWWSRQPLPRDHQLRMAIEARYIMNNVLSRVTTDDFIPPYLIWFPTFAKPDTYRKLAELRPEMLPQILRACMAAASGLAGYKELFDELVPASRPDDALMKDANLIGDVHYKEALLARVAEVGLAELPCTEDWKKYTQHCLQESSSYVQRDEPHLYEPGGGSREKLYNGSYCSAAELELMACLPEAWKIPEGDHDVFKQLDYVDWPPASRTGP